MWDDELEEEDWEPVRVRRAGTIRILALVVVAAMVIALVVPVFLRLLRGSDDGETEPQDGVRAHVVREVAVAPIPA